MMISLKNSSHYLMSSGILVAIHAH